MRGSHVPPFALCIGQAAFEGCRRLALAAQLEGTEQQEKTKLLPVLVPGQGTPATRCEGGGRCPDPGTLTWKPPEI